MSEQTRTVQNGLQGKLLTPIFYKGLFFCERGFKLMHRACLYQFEILVSSEKSFLVSIIFLYPSTFTFHNKVTNSMIYSEIDFQKCKIISVGGMLA